MTTTVSLSRKRRIPLPKEYCDRKQIKPGAALLITETNDGLYVRPAEGPTPGSRTTVRELAAVFCAVDGDQPARRQTAADRQFVAEVIKRYRGRKRAKANGGG